MIYIYTYNILIYQCYDVYNFKKLFLKIENYSDKKWKKISKYYSNEILFFDPGNKKKNILIDRIIRNK